MKRLEQEYKWQVPCKAFFKVFRKAFSQGTDVSNIVRYSITDRYFDDNSFALSRAKSALRLRKSNKQYELTLKTNGKNKNGLASRSELTLKIKAKTAQGALKEFKTLATENIKGIKDLHSLFIIKNKRQACDIKTKTFSAQAVFDDCNICTTKKTIKLYEIELEFFEGSFNDFKKFCQKVSLETKVEPCGISKVATAVANL
ncbi:MAG: CYTH domain-containing protein [Elusimicrobiaceae bacterium]|nr:CYTH domain-containing protein [Elusimicrobiaceae bacterium]